MAIEHESDSALARAVRAAGSQSAFGRMIGRRQSTIAEWLKGAKPLPAEFVLAVEAGTGVSKHELRPDIFPDETGHDAATAADRRRPATGEYGEMGINR